MGDESFHLRSEGGRSWGICVYELIVGGKKDGKRRYEFLQKNLGLVGLGDVMRDGGGWWDLVD